MRAPSPRGLAAGENGYSDKLPIRAPTNAQVAASRPTEAEINRITPDPILPRYADIIPYYKIDRLPASESAVFGSILQPNPSYVALGGSSPSHGRTVISVRHRRK